MFWTTIVTRYQRNIYRPLQKGLQNASQAIKSEQSAMLGQLSMLGPLATAGISAIAIQHELRKQFAWLEDSSAGYKR